MVESNVTTKDHDGVKVKAYTIVVDSFAGMSNAVRTTLLFSYYRVH